MPLSICAFVLYLSSMYLHLHFYLHVYVSVTVSHSQSLYLSLSACISLNLFVATHISFCPQPFDGYMSEESSPSVICAYHSALDTSCAD